MVLLLARPLETVTETAMAMGAVVKVPYVIAMRIVPHRSIAWRVLTAYLLALKIKIKTPRVSSGGPDEKFSKTFGLFLFP